MPTYKTNLLGRNRYKYKWLKPGPSDHPKNLFLNALALKDTTVEMPESRILLLKEALGINISVPGLDHHLFLEVLHIKIKH